MIWAAMSSAGVGPLRFLKSTDNADIYQEMYSTSCFLLLTSFMEMLISFYRQDLAPAHTAKGTKSWFNDHGWKIEIWQVWQACAFGWLSAALLFVCLFVCMYGCLPGFLIAAHSWFMTENLSWTFVPHLWTFVSQACNVHLTKHTGAFLWTSRSAFASGLSK